MREMWKKYSLSIVLAGLFLVSWMAQAAFQWQEFVHQSMLDGQAPDMLSFVWEFGAATFENWQSEFLQLFTFVILSTYLVHRGSPQSKETE